VRRPAAAAAALALLALAGCGSSSSGSTAGGPPLQSEPPYAALIRRADLAPCPASPGHGGSLPDTTLACLGHGPAVHLAGLTGEPTVVTVWGSWCIPCQREASYVAAAYDRDKHAVRFLGVDTEDSAKSALSFAAALRPAMHYPSVVDPDKRVLLALHQPGPPATAFLDSSGRIVHVARAPYTSTSALLRDIATYLHVHT